MGGRPAHGTAVREDCPREEDLALDSEEEAGLGIEEWEVQWEQKWEVIAGPSTSQSGAEREGRGESSGWSHRSPGAGPTQSVLGQALTVTAPDLHAVPAVPERHHVL